MEKENESTNGLLLNELRKLQEKYGFKTLSDAYFYARQSWTLAEIKAGEAY